MRDKINDAFKEWAMADPQRADLLAGIYNRKFNNLSPRRYDGGYLSLPGSNASISLRDHQKDAVARVLQGDEGSLIAHVVGAGRTYACIASVMESRRIGKANKPLVVVPNHLTEQWASDFTKLPVGKGPLHDLRRHAQPGRDARVLGREPPRAIGTPSSSGNPASTCSGCLQSSDSRRSAHVGRRSWHPSPRRTPMATPSA